MRRVTAVLARAGRARDVGVRGVAQRIAWRVYRATGAADLFFQIADEDILGSVPEDLAVPATRPHRGRPLTIGWVSTAPAPGSGGHTTLFRMVEALEARGHRCVLYFYDRHGLDAAALDAVVREHWPTVRAEVRDVRAGIRALDAVVASGWESAHLIVAYGQTPMRRLYFIQDYEPHFYGHGAEYEFAAMTYRLPFRLIALGEMLEGMIRQHTGLATDVVPFGCDSAAYRPPTPQPHRRGVVFYSRPDYARRGYQLARVALTRFHRLHPDQPIHVYGAPPRGLQVPHSFHGRLTTGELNELYGRTVTGLAMSFTNITLVAEEMLAAGNIPVVNDMPLAHLVLPNPHVRWAEPTADGLAAALSAAVTAADIDANAAAAAASVIGRSWQPTRDAVTRIIEDEVYGQ
ncbi:MULTISPECIES: glycosyltransferase family 1 protein [unclassified Microbacterium]|uniref:rhamnosyltransferase WsaF family glycosyltransferase n=1 Tax=unclassified Microbacterium TaxID=2609290 RepID=UPI00214CE2A6|nr:MULTISPECIES: glycosyltransferase family 1 protein [unclassified Microbacterium]MCR2808933.1 glycosyltransferase family 1 protein [Microbacterium sp. zg.B185]WIM18650.1 glycosyltransferase family 1 protein [Microbacterium sp. zg-B185]